MQVNDLYAALAGIYTIGHANADSLSFTAALDALYRGGIWKAVVFNVKPGVYKEQISIPHHPGTSPLKTVVIQSETSDPKDVVI
ncbi:hypothetical protein, partial [Corallococcus praedator]|uniref:hypothetical protein n=1 Tax=Corallococcus praedator TaxID=2316724 RepID=UPI001ABFFE11